MKSGVIPLSAANIIFVRRFGGRGGRGTVDDVCDGRDDLSKSLGSGIDFYRGGATDFTDVKKMIPLK